jgi:nitroreductase/NAD-dependent dihydropyrimidine dehydrogenase PreA subunit
MNVRRIDDDKCVGCGECVTDCIRNLFSQDDPDAVPTFADLLNSCAGCGHCVAVCPAGAIEYEYDTDAHAIPAPARVPYDAMLSHMASNRSVRRYRDESVSPAQIEAVLEAMRYAPSAGNRRKWSFIVITARSEIRYLAERVLRTAVSIRRMTAPLTPFLKGSEVATLRGIDRWRRDFEQGKDQVLFDAPCLIILHSPPFAACAAADAGIALTQGILAAHSLGLGACWNGFLMTTLRFRPRLRKRLGIPRGERVWGAFTMGHPAVRYHAAPPRDKLRVRWVTD